MRRLWGTLASAVAVLSATAIEAQTQSQNPNYSATPQLDEIVITAQKRTERLSDVPVSASVLSPSVLTRGNVGDISDLNNDHFEIGSKGTYWDQRLMVNASVFHTALAATDTLRINFSAAYIDAEFVDYKNASCWGNGVIQTLAEGCHPDPTVPGQLVQDVSGQTMPDSPRFKETLGVEQRVPLGSTNYDMTVGGTYAYRTRAQFQPDGARCATLLRGEAQRGILGQIDLFAIALSHAE